MLGRLDFLRENLSFNKGAHILLKKLSSEYRVIFMLLAIQLCSDFIILIFLVLANQGRSYVGDYGCGNTYKFP